MAQPVATVTAPSSSTAAARTVDAAKVYGRGQTEVRALDGVTVEFPQGQFTAIMGPSGSGKSTLLNCVAGLDTLTSGQAFVAGADLSTLNDNQLTILRRDRIGFIFQAYNLVPTLTAIENITLPMTLAGRKGDAAWIDKVVEVMKIGDRLKHRPAELSGGQQQRVAVARALVSKPAVVFADEPTGNLDSKASADVLRLLRQAVDEFDQTVVMVTHDPAAAAHADRLITLSDGRVVHDAAPGSADDVIELMKTID